MTTAVTRPVSSSMQQSLTYPSRDPSQTWMTSLLRISENRSTIRRAPFLFTLCTADRLYDTRIAFRILAKAPFSSRETCACEMPRLPATSICVRPS